MLSLAALQSPLWRAQSSLALIAVRSGGATLIAADRPVASVNLDASEHASAEMVGDREVLVRGKSLGEARLTVSLQDGRTSAYRVVVQSESARSVASTLIR